MKFVQGEFRMGKWQDWTVEEINYTDYRSYDVSVENL